MNFALAGLQTVPGVGVRNANVIRTLQTHGFKKMLNLEGGINRWASEVDQTIPIY